MEVIPEILAAFGFFGAIFICPLVYMLMRHQREMAKTIHSGASYEVYSRLEALEREVQELRARQNQPQLARSDLTNRLGA